MLIWLYLDFNLVSMNSNLAFIAFIMVSFSVEIGQIDMGLV